MDQKISDENENQHSLSYSEVLEIYSRNRNLRFFYLFIGLVILISIGIVSFVFRQSLNNQINGYLPSISTDFLSPNFINSSTNEAYFKFNYLSPAGYEIKENDFGQVTSSTPILKSIEFKSEQYCTKPENEIACKTDNFEMRILQLSAFGSLDTNKDVSEISKELLQQVSFDSESNITTKSFNGNIFYTNDSGNFILLDPSKQYALYILIGSKTRFMPMLSTISI